MATPATTLEVQATRTIRPAVHWALACVLVAPYAYLGMLLAVAIHEVIGHGVVAMAVGGEFHGFALELDGMGGAYSTAPLEAPAWKHKAIMAGGTTSTALGGVALLLLSWRSRRLPWLALPLLALATNQLLEGPPYLFWNAVHPVPPGDIAAIVPGNALARAACIVIGGLLTIAAIWCTTALLLWIAESWINRGRRLNGWPRAIVLLVIGVVPGLTWFVFDWDQLAPGLGMVPNVIGLVLHVLAAGSLLSTRWKTEAVALGLRCTLGSAAAGWVAACAAVLAVMLWLHQGVTW